MLIEIRSVFYILIQIVQQSYLCYTLKHVKIETLH